MLSYIFESLSAKRTCKEQCRGGKWEATEREQAPRWVKTVKIILIVNFDLSNCLVLNYTCLLFHSFNINNIIVQKSEKK